MIKETNNIRPEPYGTKFLEDGSVQFNFFAPDVQDVKLCIKDVSSIQEIPMDKNEDALYTITTHKAIDGTLYCYKLNNELIVPDPASRYQPQDIHGLSQLINPKNFNWEDDYKWKGKPWENAILYELHTGTFTKEGTFNAIIDKLDYFINLGITAIELMPIADFPGKRNWGYDGVLPYAPESSYGTPDDLKNLIKAAHKKGLMILLDVVYNHFGPDGNYLYTYAKSQFFDEKIKTPWGSAINFKNKYVRDFFINNAIYWINEYHFDGLRFDAFHEIYDDSSPNFIEELIKTVKANINNDRYIYLVLENDKNQSKYLEDYTAQWNDDFHHCVHILTTGEKDGYYTDYTKEKTEQSPAYFLARTLSEGFAYQGENSFYRGNILRGEKSSHLPLHKFVNFIQNHDQIGNRAFGERISQLTNVEYLKAAACLYLLSPSIPLIFMGEEWGSKSPFYFFCNFNEELSNAIRTGRRDEFSRFSQFSTPEEREKIPDPSLEKTFLDSKLNWDDLHEQNYKQMFDFYSSMLSIRKEKIVPLINKIKKSNFKIYTNKAFSVNWEIEQDDIGSLSVLANFENTSIDINSPINEKDVVAISNLESKTDISNNQMLPACTVICTLE